MFEFVTFYKQMSLPWPILLLGWMVPKFPNPLRYNTDEAVNFRKHFKTKAFIAKVLLWKSI